MNYLVGIVSLLFGSLGYTQSAIYHLQEGLDKHYHSDFRGAILDYNEAIKLDSTLSEAFFHRGICYTSLEDFDVALKDFSKAIEFDSLFTKAYYNRAATLVSLGITDEALIDLNKTVSLDPTFPNAYYLRAQIYTFFGDNDNACRDYQSALNNGELRAKEYIDRHCLEQE